MNSNQSIRKTTYSSTTFIVIIGVLSLCFLISYIYKTYMATKALATNVTLAHSICPNYWDSIGKGRCQNVNALGSCSKNNGSNIVDFSGEVFTNKNTGDYAKCKWANTCNVSWSNIDRIC